MLPRALVMSSVLAGILAIGAAGSANDEGSATDRSAAPTDMQVAERLKLTVEQVRRLHTERALNNESLLQLPPAKLARALWRLEHPRPDLPDEAAKFRLLLQQGGDQPIAPEALYEAIKKTEALRNQVPVLAVPFAEGQAPPAVAHDVTGGGPRYSVAGMPVGPLPTAVAPAAGIAPEPADAAESPASAGMLPLDREAIPLGLGMNDAAAAPPSPGGLSTSAWKWLGPGNIGGRTRSIVIHPTNPNIMWLGAVAGGVWKTINGGTSWAPLADFMTNLNVSCLVMDPTNPNVLYAGTGEGYYQGDALRGNGIFKTINGGATWTQLAATTGPNFFFVNRLAMSKNAQILLAATRAGIFRSTNGGATFTAVAAPANIDLMDVDFQPTDNTKCVASGPSGRILHSTNGGVAWTAATGIPAGSGRVEVTYAKATPTTVYASVERNSGEVYRSTDGGATFILRNTGTNYLGGQGWYDNIIWAGDPTNANFVIVGGLDLYRSTNGGTAFTQISQWWLAPASPHADHHMIVEHPKYNGTTNKTVFFSNDGGIYRATDATTAIGTTGWQELNHNYGVTQFYGAAGNTTSGRIVGGAQDNGTIRYSPPPGSNTGTEGWTTMFGGDGGFSAADPTNPNFFYGEYVRLQIHRSVNAGTSAAYIFTGITDAGGNSNFIAPFILDPNNPNTMLAGGSSLWRSVNVTASTPSWASVKPPAASLISAVAAAKGNSKIIWVGHNNGDVYKTTNGDVALPTWTQMNHGMTPLPTRYCTRVTISPSNPNRVYTTFGGYNSGNIWKSVNGGTTWTDIAASLPGAPVYDVSEHPHNPNYLYAATEVGVFASSNGGTTWFPTNLGPANVAVFELTWMKTFLVAVTHGRGLFWINLTSAAPGPAPGDSTAPPVERAVSPLIAR
jgi:photosystem II stability/assembly factor-like uncharacterized protein